MTVIQTKMAAAMCKAFDVSVEKGHNPGAVGKRILTNKMKGVGSKKPPAMCKGGTHAESQDVQRVLAGTARRNG